MYLQTILVLIALGVCLFLFYQLAMIRSLAREQIQLIDDVTALERMLDRLRGELTAHFIAEKVFREENAEWATEVNHFREATLKTYPMVKTNLKKEEVTDLELKAE